MTKQGGDPSGAASPTRGGDLKRRGLIAGMAALAAGGLMKASERSALAVTTFFTDTVQVTPPAGSNAVVALPSGSGNGILSNPSGSGAGFRSVPTGTGRSVEGFNNGADATIYGQNDGLGANHAVAGTSTGTGVGVYAQNTRPAGGSYGLYAFSASSHAIVAQASVGSGFSGVVGTAGSGKAVQGQSSSNVGVYGESGSSVGVQGAALGSNYGGFFTSGAANGLYALGAQNGIVAQANNTTFAALLASQLAAGGTAIRAEGNVFITGSLQVQGTKSAVVPGPNGTLVAVYCTESPESWFEDYGRDTLANGRKTVRIRPDFAALVHTQGYHVFIQPEGLTNGHYVTNMTASSFDVVEDGDKSTATFTWRIVAKRKDVQAARLADVTPPRSGPIQTIPVPEKAFDITPPPPPHPGR